MFCSTIQVLAGSLWLMAYVSDLATHLSFFFCGTDVHCTATESCVENLIVIKVSFSFYELTMCPFHSLLQFQRTHLSKYKYIIWQKDGGHEQLSKRFTKYLHNVSFISPKSALHSMLHLCLTEKTLLSSFSITSLCSRVLWPCI